MPVAWERLARAIADRSFEADYQFMLGTDKAGPTAGDIQPGSPGGPPSLVGVNRPGGEALPLVPAPHYGGGGIPLAPAQQGQTPLQRLESFAATEGFFISARRGGHHNAGSLHYQGRAVDLRVRDHTPAEVERMMHHARLAGFGVRDERARPPGQAVWSGAHIHLEDRR